MADYRLLIDGMLVAGDATMDVVNPATESVIAACPRASGKQLDEAVAAAKRAFPLWAARPVADRAGALVEIADRIEANSEELSRLLTLEQGKPLPEAVLEIGSAAAFFRHFATFELADKVIEDSAQRRVVQQHKPLGVVASIIPWNFPVLIAAFNVPLALLAGNSVVIKPAPTTPLTTLRLGELIADILPPGVLSIITDQNDLGPALVAHPDVAKISFTGSTETGRKVMSSAAATIKRLTLELGGNDAAIVLPDVDVAEVAPRIFGSAFFNAGQMCMAIKRVYAHEAIYDELVAALAKLADDAIVDDGLQQGTAIGPLQNEVHFEKVKAIIADARAEGRIAAGGEAPDRAGFFIRPTIVCDIDDGAKLVDEEQFGPVLPVIKYSDPEDALARANALEFGLGGSIWGKDRVLARDLASRMESGTAWINTHNDIGPHIPFGGAKQSGFGVEFAEEGLAEFTQLHIVTEAI